MARRRAGPERLRRDPKRKDTADPNAFDAMAFADANEFSLTYVPNASPCVLRRA